MRPRLAPVLAALALAAGAAAAQQAPAPEPAPAPAFPVPDPGTLGVAELVSTTSFRVCADPANAPMSAEDGSGFENRIAELFADRLGLPVAYTWFPMTTGFITRTLRAGLCDVIIGYAQGDELVQNTNHYYSSAYVLVTRADGPLADVTTLSDPGLRDARIGLIAGTPPADHVRRAGLMEKAEPYPLQVDRRVDDPSGRMLDDLRAGRIDAGLLWGPIAGSRIKDDPSLHMAVLLAEPGMPRLVYRITMGVRPADQEWKRKLNSLIRRNQPEIDAILREAGVPLVNDEGTALKPED